MTSPGLGRIVDVSNFLGGIGGNEDEEDVAINPTNPQNVFIFTNATANGANVGSAGGMMASTSFDGGSTWASRYIATGDDQFEPSCCDPSVSFDRFGNLFTSYISATADTTALLLSTNGGQSFTQLATFADTFDQPKLATGPNSIWIVWTSSSDFGLEGVKASVSGLGQVGNFSAVQKVPGSFTGSRNFGKIAVGANDQALASFQNANSGEGPDTVFVSLNTGGGFQTPVAVSNVNVGGFAFPSTQPNRSVDSESGPAFDRSSGPLSGRAYVVYTDRPSITSNQFDIFLRTSDNNGQSWSAPIRVTDDSTGLPKMLPRIKVDQSNGDLAISWLDARNDDGLMGNGDLDGIVGDDVEEYMTFSYDGGNSFEPNIQVAPFASSAILNPNGGNDFGDYTGLDFYNHIARPSWPDNGSSLGPNLDAPNSFDVGTAAVLSIINPGEDGYEPNETTDRATSFRMLNGSQHLSNLTITKHASGLYDYDNFKWTMGMSGTFTATESEETVRGGLELHLFKLVNGTLRDVGDSITRTPQVKTLSVSVSRGDIMFVQVKGRNIAPGRMGTGFYHLDVSVA